MKRSQAPSRLKYSQMNKSNHDAENEVTIQRMPLFEFLTIPTNLIKEFRVPSGICISARNVELRKVKTLGPNKKFQPLRPCDISSKLPSANIKGEALSMEELEEDECGAMALPIFEPLVLWKSADQSHKIEVVAELASKLRPHQREGVEFLFQCTMGLKGFQGQGCILADDMGLGKTLMSITVMWTLLNQGTEPNQPAARKVMIVCPTSLVGNWDNEIRKWIGEKCPTFAVKSEPKKVISSFVNHNGKAVLIISYETQRRYSALFTPSSNRKSGSPCDLLICDEAHKLKNADAALAKSLNALAVKKRILLSGTPMQNELSEFYNMVNFCNPGILGSPSEFRKRYEKPILLAREPNASGVVRLRATELQSELSAIVNEFILKRGNILNARHLPPKLVQYVCCQPSDLQAKLYDILLDSKEVRHIRDGKQLNTLNIIRQLINICCHPRMVLETYKRRVDAHESIDEDLAKLVRMLADNSKNKSSKHDSSKASKFATNRGKSTQSHYDEKLRSENLPSLDCIDSTVTPEESGKLLVLFRLMQTMQTLSEKERIVIVSNYTMTLDLIERMCKQNRWPVLRLDGTTSGSKRTNLVSTFNDPKSGAFAFLLSSKAGGCGINLIGGNRLVLFDPDWNPACDKQAAGRIWREGQQKRCFIYRFMTTGTIEEKIIQRQLSKDGLQNIIEDREQVNEFSSQELKRLFSRNVGTRSDTHETLRCSRCRNVVLKARNQVDSEASVFLDSQLNLCDDFLRDFYEFVKERLSISFGADVHIDGYEDLATVRYELKNRVFASLPKFSRRLRDAVFEFHNLIQSRIPISNEPFDLMSEFLRQWDVFVSKLFEVSKRQSNLSHTQTEMNTSEDAHEYVEQEGCPDESDFNKWSHHCSLSTVDDDVFKRALMDDDTVSFVFGLEVNWTLLMASEAQKEQEREQRKLKMQNNLLNLNERRRHHSTPRDEIYEDIDSDSDSDDEYGNKSKDHPVTVSNLDLRDRNVSNETKHLNQRLESSEVEIIDLLTYPDDLDKPNDSCTGISRLKRRKVISSDDEISVVDDVTTRDCNSIRKKELEIRNNDLAKSRKTTGLKNELNFLHDDNDDEIEGDITSPISTNAPR